MRNRGERRELTRRVVVRRLKLRTILWDTSITDWTTQEGGAFRKLSALNCRCCRRRHGNPKFGHGICRIDARSKVLGERRTTRRIQELGLLRGLDWDSDEVQRVVLKRSW
jgi:hypothetical protein